MAQATYTNSGGGTIGTFTGGSAADPVSVRGLINVTGSNSPFNGDITLNDFVAIQDSDYGDELVIDTHFNPSSGTVILSAAAGGPNNDSGWFVFGASSNTVVDTDTVATFIIDSGGQTGSDKSKIVMTEGALIDVAEGGRIRYAIGNFPTGTLNVQDNFRSVWNNDNASSNIRITIDGGSYAIGERSWLDSVSASAFSGGLVQPDVHGTVFSASVLVYNVTPDVLVRDFLYRGDYIDWRPGGTGWAPPNGGGFVTRLGMKWLAEGQTHTAPLIFGEVDADFDISISTTQFTPADAIGLWQYGLCGPSNLTNRNIFRNFNGLDWATRLAIYVQFQNDNTPTNIENHVYPTATVQDENLAPLEGTKVKMHTLLPTYGGNRTAATAVLDRAAYSLGYTDVTGSTTVGIPSAPLTISSTADSLTDAPIITQVLRRVGRGATQDYVLSSDVRVAYDSNITQTYDVFRMGQQILFNQAAGLTVGQGAIDLGSTTLPVDNNVSIVINQETVALGSPSTSINIPDTTATEAEVYSNGELIPFTTLVNNVSDSTITFASSQPAGNYVVLSYNFPAIVNTLDNAFDVLYRHSVINELNYVATNNNGYLDFGAQNVVLNAAGGERVTIVGGFVTMNLNNADGTLTEGGIFNGIGANSLNLEDTIKFGVDVGTGGLITFPADVTFTDNLVVDTTEPIVGRIQVPAGTYVISGSDNTNLSIEGPGGSEFADFTLINGATTPTAIAGSNVRFLETATFTADLGEAYDSTKLGGVSFFTSTDGITFTAETTPTPTSTGNTVTWSLGVQSGETLYYALAYDGKEIVAGDQNNTTVALTDIPSSTINFTTTLDTDFQAALTSVGTGDSIEFRTEDTGITLTDAESRYAVRLLLQASNTLDQMAQKLIDDDLLTIDSVGLVVKTAANVNFQKVGNALGKQQFTLQALAANGDDVSGSITNADIRLEVRFLTKAVTVFTTTSTFEFVTDEVKSQNSTLQSNLNTAFKTQL